MGANIDLGDKKSVDVQLNIVPYIDLMSCLTAFLLVTAVWVNLAQITIQPKGKNRNQPVDKIEEPPPVISVLIQSDMIYVGVARLAIDPVLVKKDSGAYDWTTFKNALTALKKEEAFAERNDIEIAAESTTTNPVKYDDVVHAMDLAVEVGFKGVGLSEPTSLAWRPTL
ncbi:MAG TPA: biopolymer transporter ExbD [Kofleriaceae bacterium]|jgi:biopolymer transport protein ExbD|nr:biopolymer transporter ExbD [Kofleriaceae bacterium]